MTILTFSSYQKELVDQKKVAEEKKKYVQENKEDRWKIQKYLQLKNTLEVSCAVFNA